MIDYNKIEREEDRKLIKEAIELCEAKFFRASYLMAFLAGVEALRRKIKEQAIKIGGIYKEQWSKIERTEKSHNAAEKEIIDGALKCKLIDEKEHSKMDHFYKMRNLYAHPYETAPDCIDCQHIINSIFESVLAKKVYLTNTDIDSYLNKFVNESVLLPNNKEQIESYINAILERSNKDSIPYIFNNLSREYIHLTDSDPLCFINPFFDRLEYAIKFILKRNTIDEIFTGIDIEDFIIRNKTIANDFFWESKVFLLFNEHIQDIIFNILTNSKSYYKIGELLYDTIVNEDLINAKLEKRTRTWINNNTTKTELQYFPAEYVIDKIIEHLLSTDFDRMNAAIKPYQKENKVFRKTVHRLDNEKQEKFGNAIAEAYKHDIRGYSAIQVKYFVENEFNAKDYDKVVVDSFVYSYFIQNETFNNTLDKSRVNTVSEIFNSINNNKRQNKILEKIKTFIETFKIPASFDWDNLLLLRESPFQEIQDLLESKKTYL